jgi:hypothetical protein
MKKRKIYRIFDTKTRKTLGLSEAQSLPQARRGLPPNMEAELFKHPVYVWDAIADRWYRYA